MNNQMDNQPPVKPPNEKLFWYAYLGAIFIYSVVAVMILNSGEGFEEGKGFIELDAGVFSTLFYVLLFVSMVQFAILLKWDSKGVYKLMELLPDDKKKNIFMVKYTLAAAMAIYGLMLFLMNGNSSHLLLFSGLAVVGMLLSYPKK